MLRYKFNGPDIAKDIRSKYRFNGDLLKIFSENTGEIIHKWHHYIPVYDRYFSKFRNRRIRFLEIGVSKGGSLKMWRQYFGPDAVIYGVDIDPECAKLDGDSAQVRIGSQDDPDFLRQVITEMGGVDVILDDGSHHMGHIRASLDVLFPLLSDGGIYMIEDLHTAFSKKFGGGAGQPDNFFRFVYLGMINMHRWYHKTQRRTPEYMDDVCAMHIHDSIVVFEKDPSFAPTHSRVGQD